MKNIHSLNAFKFINKNVKMSMIFIKKLVKLLCAVRLKSLECRDALIPIF